MSNFDPSDLEELSEVPGRQEEVQTNQVLYNLTRRGIELDLLPACRARGLPVMAYSPVEQGRILSHRALRSVASRCGATPAQVALAWVLRDKGVVAIPKATEQGHVRENRGALDLKLEKEDLTELDRAFPAPDAPVPLELL